MNKTTRLKKPQIPEIESLYNFDDLGGRPKYGGVEMTSETDIPSYEEVMEDVETVVSAEAADRSAADNALQTQIDAIVSSSDVKDVVGTKAQLDAYDTSTLGDNDIIKVLTDETQNNATTYYRYIEQTDSFSLIGSEGPFYTKSESDALLNNKADKATTYTKTEVDSTVAGLRTDISGKQDRLTAGENITIDGNVISSSAGIKNLTTDDYNYDSDNDDVNDSIAIWLLEDGLYCWSDIPSNAKYFSLNDPVSGFNSRMRALQGNSFLKVAYDNTGRSMVFCLGDASGSDPQLKTSGIIAAYDVTDAGTARYNPDSQLLSQYNLQNVLNITSAGYALDARQGKVLDDKIGGDLSNLDTTDKTSLINAINELVASYPNDFEGTDGTSDGTHGLVPAPTTSDAGKFLKADGTWAAVGSGPTVVQTTGTSTTDVMSQVATSNLVYPSGAETTKTKIAIGNNSYAANEAVALGHSAYTGQYGISIGYSAGHSSGYNSAISIGRSAKGNNGGAIAIGIEAVSNGTGSVALGSHSSTPQGVNGVVGIGTSNTSHGYNGSNYRLLTGLYDPQSAHDAATKDYADNLTVSHAAISGSTAPSTATEAKYIGQLYYDTTNEDLYYCSAITAQGTTPETYEYTWTQMGGGSSVTLYNTYGQNTDGAMTQKATTDLVYTGGDPTKINIGDNGVTGGTNSIIIGSEDSGTITAATDQIIIGHNVTESVSTGIVKDSIAIGHGVTVGGTSGADAVVIGHNAKVSGHSIAIGEEAGRTTTADYAVMIGRRAGYSAAGNESVCIGDSSKSGNNGIAIGYNSNSSGSGNGSIAIGHAATARSSGVALGGQATGETSVSLGYSSNALGNSQVSIGNSAGYQANAPFSVSLGAFSKARAQGVVDVSTGTNNYGYQGTGDVSRTSYRIISGVHDGEQDHDAATVGQLNTAISSVQTTVITNSEFNNLLGVS